MLTLLMCAVLAQTPQDDPVFEAQKQAGQAARARTKSPGVAPVRDSEIYVPKHEVVKRCVSYASDADFREKLRDLAESLESSEAPAIYGFKSRSIREFLIHRNYETAARMLLALAKEPRVGRGREITLSLATILRATDRWKYNPVGAWDGNVLPANLYSVIQPKSQVTALESNTTLKELKKGFKDVETVDELLMALNRKYSGEDHELFNESDEVKDAA